LTQSLHFAVSIAVSTAACIAASIAVWQGRKHSLYPVLDGDKSTGIGEFLIEEFIKFSIYHSPL
jgi:hypothetical protein